MSNIVQASGATVNAQASTRFKVVEFNPVTHKAIIPDGENESGTSLTGTTSVDETTSDEDTTSKSGTISIGAKTSKRTDVIISRPTPVTIKASTTAQVINVTSTVLPTRTTIPTTRPTIQSGFDTMVAFLGLGAVIFHIVLKAQVP